MLVWLQRQAHTQRHGQWGLPDNSLPHGDSAVGKNRFGEGEIDGMHSNFQPMPSVPLFAVAQMVGPTGIRKGLCHVHRPKPKYRR